MFLFQGELRGFPISAGQEIEAADQYDQVQSNFKALARAGRLGEEGKEGVWWEDCI